MRYKRFALGVLALSACLVCVLPGVRAAPAAPASEIVVAIRYLLPTGMSHAHLYLYREEGKLLRQLTRDNSGQDSGPVFAPGGETIVFTRERPKNIREFWSIQPRGGGLTRLKEAPSWYTAAKNSPYFRNIDLTRSLEATPPGPPHYRSSDDTIVITLDVLPDDPDAQTDGPGHGKNFLIQNRKTDEQREAGKLPGFEGLFSILTFTQQLEQHFLIENGLRLAFFDLHLNSTDGDTTYALDLSGPVSRWRIVRLSPNGATPFPLPGEPAFLTQAYVRYVPIAGTTKTANCSYIERWDARLRKVRFARSGAAIAYGASLYRPGRTPAVVTIPKSD